MKAAVLLCSLLLLSCGRNPDFKFREQAVTPAKSVSKNHLLKEISGGAADIIWVIDNSGSMDHYQTEVIQNTEKFISSFSVLAHGFDWRIGLLSTDTRDEPYIGFTPQTRLDFSTADPVIAFQRAVSRLGTSGSGTEKSFDPVTQALDRSTDFLRPHAKLFLILLSDEEEQSSQSASQFYQYLLQKKGKPENVVTYGIFEMEEAGCGTEKYAGEAYEQFMNLSGGQAFPICQQDYGKLLSKVGSDIGEKFVRPRINLDRRPKAKTLKVYYKEVLLPSGPKDKGGFWYYSYDENAVIFHDLSFALGDNESVRIDYELPESGT